jgi:hypothetical protein
VGFELLAAAIDVLGGRILNGGINQKFQSGFM